MSQLITTYFGKILSDLQPTENVADGAIMVGFRERRRFQVGFFPSFYCIKHPQIASILLLNGSFSGYSEQWNTYFKY